MIYELIDGRTGKSTVDLFKKMQDVVPSIEENVRLRDGNVLIRRSASLIPGRILTPDRIVATAPNYPVGIMLTPSSGTRNNSETGTTRPVDQLELRSLPRVTAHRFTLILPPLGLDGTILDASGKPVVVDAVIPAYGSPTLNKDLITKYLFLQTTIDAGTPRTPQNVDAGEVWLPRELEEVLNYFFPHTKRYNPQDFTG